MLERQDKELAAIGASIGANCQPCIEHHIPAGRDAGLSEQQLVHAVKTAQQFRTQATELLAARADQLLGGTPARRADEPAPPTELTRDSVLVALGASVGANTHKLLRIYVAAALSAGLTPAQVSAALKMAQHVQHRAGEITAEKANHALDELAAVRSTAVNA